MIGHEDLRWLDRLAGVPACALLSLLRRIGRLVRTRRTDAARPIRNLLFVQLAESGSMVLADPAMRGLVARTGARARCVTFAANRASLAITGTIADEDVFAIRTGSLRELLTDALRLLIWVRRSRIDAIVDFELFSRLTAALCVLTGVARRAGFHRFGGAGLYRGDLYSHPVAFNPHLHIAQNYLMLVEALLGPCHPPAPRLPVSVLRPRLEPRAITAADRAAVRARLTDCLPGHPPAAQRLLLINANASALLPQRRWPPAHFAELIAAVLGEFPDVQVLLIGAAEDGPSTSAIAAQVGHPRCKDVAGRFALAELPALFSLAAAMVSNDSGPAHFAAVTDLPVIVLFGPETPALFRPLGDATVISARLACSPCVSVDNQRRTRCTDNQCMKRIGVPEVLAATRALLEVPPAPGLPGRGRRAAEAVGT